MVALEKREASLLAEQRRDSVEKLGGGRLPQQRSGEMQTRFNPLGDDNVVESADEILKL